jgi:membrane-associated protease RseP (regulator of RpoE activity)
VIFVETPEVSHVERQGWVSLGVGAGLALLASALPQLRFIFSYLTILVHEMGHALTAWLFGYPAIPTFDFAYGGGITLQGDRIWPLLLVPLGLLAWMGWQHRANPRAKWAWSIAAVSFLVLALSPAHRHLMVLMGHGTELIIATVFIYRALSGSAIKVPAERPLYAACGLFIVFESLRFGYGLMTSEELRYMYEQAKGGGHWMDFSQLAGEFTIRVKTLATLFFLGALAVPGAALLLFRYREYIQTKVVGTLGADS